jgi:regulator of replication initiation timing
MDGGLKMPEIPWKTKEQIDIENSKPNDLEFLKAEFEKLRNENAALKSENGNLKKRVADTENAVLGLMFR